MTTYDPTHVELHLGTTPAAQFRTDVKRLALHGGKRGRYFTCYPTLPLTTEGIALADKIIAHHRVNCVVFQGGEVGTNSAVIQVQYPRKSGNTIEALLAARTKVLEYRITQGWAISREEWEARQENSIREADAKQVMDNKAYWIQKEFGIKNGTSLGWPGYNQDLTVYSTGRALKFCATVDEEQAKKLIAYARSIGIDQGGV